MFQVEVAVLICLACPSLFPLIHACYVVFTLLTSPCGLFFKFNAIARLVKNLGRRALWKWVWNQKFYKLISWFICANELKSDLDYCIDLNDCIQCRSFVITSSKCFPEMSPLCYTC
jgi:hypothetical protein